MFPELRRAIDTPLTFHIYKSRMRIISNLYEPFEAFIEGSRSSWSPWAKCRKQISGLFRRERTPTDSWSRMQRKGLPPVLLLLFACAFNILRYCTMISGEFSVKLSCICSAQSHWIQEHQSYIWQVEQVCRGEKVNLWLSHWTNFKTLISPISGTTKKDERGRCGAALPLGEPFALKDFSALSFNGRWGELLGNLSFPS